MEIGDAVATMAVGRPDNLDPEAWFEAAIRIDQSRATNEAFRMAIQPVPSLSILPRTLEGLPETAEELEPTMPDVYFQPEENAEVLDIKGMSADEVRRLIRELSGTKTPKTSGKPQEKVTTRQSPNRYSELIVEDTPETPAEVFTLPEAACAKPYRKPKWEKQLPKNPKIGAAEVGPNSLYLRVEIESPETQRKQGVRALVDSGATGLFIDREYVKSNQIPTKKLSQPIPVYNVDGTKNADGATWSDLGSGRPPFTIQWTLRKGLVLGHQSREAKPHSQAYLVERSQPRSRLEDRQG